MTDIETAYDKLRAKLESRRNEFENSMKDLSDIAGHLESQPDALPDLFVTSEGKEYAQQVIEITKFADFFVSSSIWGNPDFSSALLGAFGPEYKEQLQAHLQIKPKEDEALADHERKKMDAILSMVGSGERRVDWNRFVLLTLATGIYAYCGVLVNGIKEVILSTETRRALLLKGCGEEWEGQDVKYESEQVIHKDPYSRMKELLRGFGLTQFVHGLMTTHGIMYYQEDFYALKKGRDKGAHVQPALSMEFFETPRVRKKVNAFLGDIERGRKRRASLPAEEIVQTAKAVEEETGPLGEVEKKKLVEHLESGKDDVITEAMMRHLEDQASMLVGVSWIPIMGSVFPAIFERVSHILLDVLEELGF